VRLRRRGVSVYTVQYGEREKEKEKDENGNEKNE
jgi:hypothetical protein